MATYTYTPVKQHEGRAALVAKIQAFSEQVQTTHRQLTENESDGEVVGDLFLEMTTDQINAMTRQLTLQLLAFNHTKSLGHAEARRAAEPTSDFETTSTVAHALDILDKIERQQGTCKASVTDAAMDETAGMAAFERIEALTALMSDAELDLLRARIKVLANDRFFARVTPPSDVRSVIGKDD
jgi:hypothetical protein